MINVERLRDWVCTECGLSPDLKEIGLFMCCSKCGAKLKSSEICTYCHTKHNDFGLKF
jgi:hypothetical protein